MLFKVLYLNVLFMQFYIISDVYIMYFTHSEKEIFKN